VNEIAEAFLGKEWKSRVRYEGDKKGEAQNTKVSNKDIDKAKSEIGLEIKNDVLDYIYSFISNIEYNNNIGNTIFNNSYDRLTDNERKVLNDMYGTKDIDNDIDKVYQGIIQEDLPYLTPMNDYSKDDSNTDSKAANPAIDEFTDKIRKMRESNENPFIYWK
jgi:hypothetical protein